jgi:predicted PurR-regulated permease PerM
MIDQRRLDWASLILMVVALLVLLNLGLLPALLSGLVVYESVQAALPMVRRIGISNRLGKFVVVGLITVLVVLLIALAVLGVKSLLVGRTESIGALLQKMAEVIDTARNHLPASIQKDLPANAEELQRTASQWLRAHARELQQVGTEVGRLFAHIIIGLIIGGLIAIGITRPGDIDRPLSRALTDRAAMLANTFRRVVFAQARISALNTFLTGIYLMIGLPAFGYDLPLVKTIVATTFVVGLLPVVGNLISNTIIVIVSLSISPYAAIASLLFLIFIHKLEYFINARLMGVRIRARAWEILLAMLVMDAAFGVPGLIAAPIYYGYIKDELTARRLV